MRQTKNIIRLTEDLDNTHYVDIVSMSPDWGTLNVSHAKTPKTAWKRAIKSLEDLADKARGELDAL